MNNIEITEEQKVKLLEMSNKLFVGTKFKDLDIKEILMSNQQGSCHGHSSKESQIFVYIATDYGFPINIIHWFEFVMTHLSNKIYTKSGRVMSGYLNFFQNFNNCKEHPIDYLYKEFKLLNK